MKLQPLEIVGVTAVGFLFGAAGAALASRVEEHHYAAMVGVGAVSYIAGVFIGASRPAQGWMGGQVSGEHFGAIDYADAMALANLSRR